MAGQNEFKAFATGPSANVLTPANYAAKVDLIANGFQSGVAKSDEVNTPIRQASFVAAAIAQIIANNNINALDDGDLASFVANLLVSIMAQGVTPPQFDASTKIATMGALKRFGVQYSGFHFVDGNVTLTNADVGGVVQVDNTAGATTVVLPLTSGIAPAVGRIELANSSDYNVTVVKQGTDVLASIDSSIPAGGIVVGPGGSLVVACQVSGIWLAIAGTSQLSKSSAFGSSLTTEGWQLLPNGRIEQWGQTSVAVPANTATANDWTFPIPFPNECLQCYAIAGSHVGSSRTAESFTTTAAHGFAIHTLAATLITRWHAIGR